MEMVQSNIYYDVRIERVFMGGIKNNCVKQGAASGGSLSGHMTSNI